MEHSTEDLKQPVTLGQLNEALNSGTFRQVRSMLNSLHPSEVAHLLESSPPKERNTLWTLIDKDQEGEILQYLSDEIRTSFLSDMNTQEVIEVTEGLDTDDLADLLQSLPDRVIREVLNSMDEQRRQRLEHVLSYPEDTAGGLMNTDTITIRPEITLNVLLRYLRRHHKEIPDNTDSLLVVNQKNKLLGILPLTKLLVSEPDSSVAENMLPAQAIPASASEQEVTRLFERRDLISAAVVNEAGELVGRITVDDVIDVIREQADRSLMNIAGLDEDQDTFAPVFKSAKRRALWLGINLITAFIASSVIGLFQATIQQVVALAVLMPIVASMGGIAVNQTLTLVIRGMALGHISTANAFWLLTRELGVGAVNGLLWSVIIAVAATFWFKDPAIGFIIAGAIIINLTVAVAVGATLPLLLRRFNIDPALAATVIGTTVTDVVGFLSFLGLATLYFR